jgi:methanogenic corrinoid protein MtbC1
MNARKGQEETPRHPIKVVSNRTGLTPEVLRIWEKRYSVVSPGRSSGGQRLYSDQDIERLRLLRALTLGGRRIGELSKESTPALQKILAEDQRATPPERPGPETPSRSPAEFVAMAMDAVTRMDEQELRSVLARAHSTFGTTDLVEGVVGPLARELGAQWARGEIQVFKEHFATVEIRRLLIQVMESASTRKKDPGILVSTPVGEEHELGAMLVAAVAAAEGWRVIYLGPNLPATDIAEAAKSQKVLAVALSAVYSKNTSSLEAEFRDLRDQLAKKTHLLIGGAALTLSPRALRELGAESLSNLHELPGVLGRIASEA